MMACCWSVMRPGWLTRKAAKEYVPAVESGLMAAATIIEAARRL